ncbi:hypothetical protein C8R26_10341 [Nitrosomonas oligotropha]|uniref:Uncharacterized protein n=2 Tax=Nitrosomonas oligotropha TaxID=42354 RepID=A0A2T5I372_9PROT|nr:hypothetical protein C8R26_10341 [Nitrosomonas oligotropha]
MIVCTLLGLPDRGIFEGLLLALAMHGIVNLIVLRHVDNLRTRAIMKKYFERFAGKGGAN